MYKRQVCDEHGLLLVMDGSLLSDNLWFIKEREDSEKDKSIAQIARDIADLCDCLLYTSRCV